MSVPIVYVDKDGQEHYLSELLPEDGITNALKIVEYEHHEVHGGSSFLVCDVRNVSTTTMKWQITTPDSDNLAHMIFDIECTGEVLVLVTEGSDRTDGAELEEINRYRDLGNEAKVIVTRTPTEGSTDGATAILHRRSGATGVASKTLTGGGARGVNEYILKRNTKYVVAVTTYADVWVSFCIDWYEHTNK